MDKKIIIGLIIAVVALGGVWALFSASSGGGRGGSPAETATSSTSTSAQQAAPARPAKSGVTQKPSAPAKIVGVNSISYLFNLKQSLVCSITTTSAYIRRSGTMYVADAKMRGNFASYINGALIRTSMIDDGTYLYAWTVGASKGLRLSAASSASGSAIASNGGLDPDTNFSFACNPWTEDASVFMPPISISFSNTL